MLGFLRFSSIHPLNFGLKEQMIFDESGESEESDVSDDSSELSDEDNGKESNITDAKFTVASLLALEGADMLRTPCFCKGNEKRDRTGIHLWSAKLDDVMFSRQFRLHRDDFYYVL